MRTLFDSAGSLREHYETLDWAGTPLGPVEGWSDPLVSAVDLMLNTRFPITLLWGPEYVLVYNEAYVDLIGDKHPRALGRPACEVFPEAWDVIGPMLDEVAAGRGATWTEDNHIPLQRRGFLEECYFTFSYSAVRDRDGRVEGVMDIASESTARVIAGRRLHLLTRVAERLADVEDADDVADLALPLLRASVQDFAAVDLRYRDTTRASSPVVPALVETEAGHEAWLRVSVDGPLDTYLVVALSRRLAPDHEYLGFVQLVAAAVSQALDRVRVRSTERRAAEAQRDMSEAFQRSLLPERVSSTSLEVAVRYQPALELAQIGGDWYDLFELPDGTVTVVIGDVAGHDQQSAATMAQVRNLLRGVAYTMHPGSPGQVLAGLDRAMLGAAPDIVATAVLGQVTRGADGPVGFSWSNAGHPPPVVIGPDGRAALLEHSPDLMIGVDDGSGRVDHQVPLQPGTTLVFYTDGLIERRAASITDGLAWLVQVLDGRGRLDVEELCDHLLTSAVGEDDDIALLVVRV